MERIEREEKRDEERERREARLLITLKEAQPAVPQHVNIKKLELPKMRDKDDPETLMKYLEVALTTSKIPREELKDYVQPQLTLEAGEKILGVLQSEDSTFDDIVAALTGCNTLTFAFMAEALFAPVEEADRTKPRVVNEKLKRCTKKLLQEAETAEEMIDKVAVAFLRSKLTMDLKKYLDLSETTTNSKYIMNIEEWAKCRGDSKSVFKDGSQEQGYRHSQPNSGFQRLVTCFHCGKGGHISKKCRSRLEGEKQQRVTTPDTVMGTEPQVTNKTPGNRKPIVCFSCHQAGLKSSNCPKKQQAAVKRIQIPIKMLKKLKHNDIIAKVQGIQIPTTVYSGADRAVIPEELITHDQFTGEVQSFNGVAQGTLNAKVVNVTSVLQVSITIEWHWLCLETRYTRQQPSVSTCATPRKPSTS